MSAMKWCLLLLVAQAVCAAAEGPVFIWREVEELAREWHFWAHRPAKERSNPDWMSGRGAASTREPKSFSWAFRIQSEDDPDTLLPVERTYYVWLRIYGYAAPKRMVVTFDGQPVGTFVMKKPEPGDGTSPWIGGRFYWQRAAMFKAKGGEHTLKFDRLDQHGTALDALLVTTDVGYTPKLLEACDRAAPEFFTDAGASEVIASFAENGVCASIVTPVRFAVLPLGGHRDFVPRDQSAIMHLVLPNAIRLRNVSSHYAGLRWKHSLAAGQLTLRPVGEETLNGRLATHYEIGLRYMGLDMVAFIQARAEEFDPGRTVAGKYWLVHNGRKQAARDLPLTMVAIPETPPFKTLFIGPAGGNATPMCGDYPGVAEAITRAGMNFYNPHWLDLRTERHPELMAPFFEACRKKGLLLTDEHSPFGGTYGPNRETEAADFAIGLDGRPTVNVSLMLGAAVMDRNLGRLRRIGAMATRGVQGVVLDDEVYNKRADTMDYSDRMKQGFRKYLAAHTELVYRDPVEIVSKREAYPKLYAAWVDYKCDRLIKRYARFRKAFDDAFDQAGGTGRRFFIPQILKDSSPERSKRNTFWDYRRLAQHSTQISPMIYSYTGIAGSAEVGDLVAMFHKEIGRNIIAPTLLAGYRGSGEIKPGQRALVTYQIFECLMHKSPGILFWRVEGAMNPLILARIADGIRAAQPYEEVFLHGEPAEGVRGEPASVRLRSLRHGDQLLVYAADYERRAGSATIHLSGLKPRSAVDAMTRRAVALDGDSFAVDFHSEQGRLFCVTLAE